MLMVLKPGREEFAKAIFDKWELDFAVIGEVTDTGHMVLEWQGQVVCDIPLGPLAEDAPLYDRPAMSREEYKAWAKVKPLGDIPESTDIGADLLKLMASPDIASRAWIWQQYDSQVGGDTAQLSGGDAAVVRIHGTNRALAMTTDCTPRYCYADPYEGGKQAVAETYRNICAVGAKPLAITNCLNFANPQRPEIMAQIVGCLEGMADACRALDYPIVSGNVSLYNESKATGGGSAILPTPAIGGVGVLEDVSKMATIGFKEVGNPVWLVGQNPDFAPAIGQSVWLREIVGRETGEPPSVDLANERLISNFVRDAINSGLVNAVHDVSDGGFLVAIAEMALAGGIGFDFHNADNFGDWNDRSPAAMAHQESLAVQRYFSEVQSTFVVTTSAATERFLEAVETAKIPFAFLGNVGGDAIHFSEWSEDIKIPLADLRAAHESFFKSWMEN
jgi:phosphoribosylformylglycinamidine synthase